MKYINQISGLIIDIDSELSGSNWEKFEETVEKNENQSDEAIETAEVSDEGSIDDYTVAGLKQELEGLGVEFDPKAKKQELYDLLMEF